MQREFFINLLFLLGINLIVKPFYIFGIDRTVQNVVGEESYGIYFALFNFTLLLQIINDFGIHNFNSRNIAQHRHLIDKYFPNVLILKFLLAGSYMLATLAVGYFTGYTGNYFQLLVFIIFNQILISLIFYFRSNLAGLGKYPLDSFLSTLDKLLMILICGYLLWGVSERTFRIEWFVYAQTTSLAITALIAFFLVKNHLTQLTFKFNPIFLLFLLKKSYPFALIVFLMTLYTRIDAVMIEQMLPDGKREAGIYGAGYRLLDASNMIGFLFAGLLLPMFSRLLIKKESINNLLGFSFQLMWAGAVTLAVSTFFFRIELMDWLYVNATPYWGDVMGYLILSFIAVSCGSYIFGALLTANGNLRQMNIIFFIAIILNILLNAWLIPSHKALGAAAATFGTQAFAMIGQILLAKKAFNLSFNFVLIFKVVAFALLTIGLSYTYHQYSPLTWKVNFLLSTLTGILLALLLKLIDPKSFLSLLSTKLNRK